jgi:hypothetical protein
MECSLRTVMSCEKASNHGLELGSVGAGNLRDPDGPIGPCYLLHRVFSAFCGSLAALNLASIYAGCLGLSRRIKTLSEKAVEVSLNWFDGTELRATCEI